MLNYLLFLPQQVFKPNGCPQKFPVRTHLQVQSVRSTYLWNSLPSARDISNSTIALSPAQTCGERDHRLSCHHNHHLHLHSHFTARTTMSIKVSQRRSKEGLTNTEKNPKDCAEGARMSKKVRRTLRKFHDRLIQETAHTNQLIQCLII